MPNILTGSITGSSPSQVSVGVASAQAVAFNSGRTGLVLTNISTGTIYLAFGASAAVVGSGIVLTANGGTWAMDEYNFSKEIINAIAHQALSGLALQEFIV